MSKLFISYSRDDKAWVYELWRALRDRAHHDAWIDQRLIPAQDWWEGILQSIENCECFIYVMTPKSTESIYCSAELNYALALNKPILPLMLKQCDVPQPIRSKRIQYEIVRDDMSMGDTLFAVAQGLTEVRVGLVQGKYPPPSALPERPDEPRPEHKPEQVSEVFMLAEEAAVGNNISLAIKLFQQVMDADPSNWGVAAAERLGEIQHENKRNKEYLTIVQMVANPNLIKGAKAAWRVYVQKYGIEYDPRNIAPVLSETLKMPQIAATKSSSRSLELMPKPFEWITIPVGKVTLKQNDPDERWSWFDEGTFDVGNFSIAKYPITNEQYRLFLFADGYNQQQWWETEGWKVRNEENWTEPRFWKDTEWNKADHPVVGISWYEAKAFCKWLSNVSDEKINLPSSMQWQRAAQGDTGWLYPYGNQFNNMNCNFKEKHTVSVNQYEGKGNSPFDVVDMSGNVWEWCDTEYIHDRYDNIYGRVQRGGSFNSGFFKDGESQLCVDYHTGAAPASYANQYGFRIIRV